MSIEEIKEIILSVLAPVGGVAGLVAIITSIAKSYPPQRAEKHSRSIPPPLTVLKARL